MLKKFYLIVISIIFQFSLYGQYIVIRKPSEVSHDQHYYVIYDFEGNMRFKLPDNSLLFLANTLVKKNICETQDWSININERIITQDDNFLIINRNQSILPISTPDSTYLLDFEGKLVKSFGKDYTYLSQVSEGIFIGYCPIEDRRGAFMVEYLKENGEPLFDDKKYWDATDFSEGYAVIQEENEYGDWKIINLKGDEILSLSSLLNKKIIKANKFINGFANIIVQKDSEDIKNISGRVKDNKDSIQHYFDIPLNSTEHESRLASELYRVNAKGDVQRLDWNTSILNDMYSRKYYSGNNYMVDVDASNKISVLNIIDSLVTVNGKLYITKDSFQTYYLKNINGENLDFPIRYSPVKIFQNYVLGKRRNNYVIHNPITKENIFFTDSTPLHFDEILQDSDNEVESTQEFLKIENRILRIGCFGIKSILTLTGSLVFDFEKSPIDNSITPLIEQLSTIFKCPDGLDYKEIIAKKLEYLTIECAEINLDELQKLVDLKMLSLINVNQIFNASGLIDLLNKNININIYGEIKLEDLGLELNKINKGSLIINDKEYIKKQ